jgi:hypothetical protein
VTETERKPEEKVVKETEAKTETDSDVSALLAAIQEEKKMEDSIRALMRGY